MCSIAKIIARRYVDCISGFTVYELNFNPFKPNGLFNHNSLDRSVTN